MGKGTIITPDKHKAKKLMAKLYLSTKKKMTGVLAARGVRKTESQPTPYLPRSFDKPSTQLSAEETALEKELLERQKIQLADQMLLQKALRDLGRNKASQSNTRTETLMQNEEFVFDGLTVTSLGKEVEDDASTPIKVGESILEVNGTFAMNTAHVMMLLQEATYPTQIKVAQVGQNFSDI